MRKKILCVLLYLLMQSTYAGAHIPSVCPSLFAIKSVGFQSVKNTVYGWLGYTTCQYDTNITWSLVSLIGTGFDNANQALQKGNADLALLTHVQGPTQDEDSENQWYCRYSGNGVIDILLSASVD